MLPGAGEQRGLAATDWMGAETAGTVPPTVHEAAVRWLFAAPFDAWQP